MEKFSKKTLLNYVNGSGVYGAPGSQTTVKFQYTNNIATAAASSTPGALTFAADENGNAAIYAQGTLVSSKIQNVVANPTTGNKHGGKTITVTYIGTAGQINTSTFNVIDEAGLEAYFANSKTIALNDSSIYEVKTKANGGIAVDPNGAGLYAVLSDIFGVDATTIGFKTDNKTIQSLVKIAYIDGQAVGTGKDRIALTDVNGVELTHVDVEKIIGGGIVERVVYNKDNNTLTIYWIGGATTTIDLSELFDISDWAVKSDSTDFLSLTVNVSTAEIGVKKADVTFTPAAGSNPANLSVNTANGEILVASDAIPAIKSYVDAVQGDNGISAEGDSYIDASVDATDNKKINIKAQTSNITVSKSGTDDTSITGTSGKLVDAADAASKVGQFVNTRISEEINKLNADIISDDDTYVKVEVKETKGKISDVSITQTKSTITASATALSATTGIADGAEFASGVKTYVDGQIDALDSKLDIKSPDSSLTFDVSVVNGKIVEGHIGYVKSTVSFTAKSGDTPANLTGTPGFLTGGDIATIKNYIDDKTGTLDSSVFDADDTHSFVSVEVVQENGALKSDTVSVTYTDISVGPGTIEVTKNGVATGNDIAAAVNGALVWTIL